MMKDRPLGYHDGSYFGYFAPAIGPKDYENDYDFVKVNLNKPKLAREQIAKNLAQLGTNIWFAQQRALVSRVKCLVLPVGLFPKFLKDKSVYTKEFVATLKHKLASLGVIARRFGIRLLFGVLQPENSMEYANACSIGNAMGYCGNQWISGTRADSFTVLVRTNSEKSVAAFDPTYLGIVNTTQTLQELYAQATSLKCRMVVDTWAYWKAHHKIPSSNKLLNLSRKTWNPITPVVLLGLPSATTKPTTGKLLKHLGKESGMASRIYSLDGLWYLAKLQREATVVWLGKSKNKAVVDAIKHGTRKAYYVKDA